MAKLYFRYGAMNSGKSTALMQVAHNYEERGMKVKIVKPLIDTKGGDNLHSRLGVKRKVDYFVDSNSRVFDEFEEISKTEKVDCILVDEAQFLNEEQVDDLLKITIFLNIPVICYGLRTDFSNKGFPGATRLMLVAHTIEEMKTICACGKKATFNGRKINGKYVFTGKQVAIDDKEEISYEALCPHCYFKYKKEWELKNGK